MVTLQENGLVAVRRAEGAGLSGVLMASLGVVRRAEGAYWWPLGGQAEKRLGEGTDNCIIAYV